MVDLNSCCLNPPTYPRLKRLLLIVTMLSRLTRAAKSLYPFRQITASTFIMHTDKKAKLSNETSAYPMVLSDRPAVCNLVPAGQCQFNPTFQPVQLLDRLPCGEGGTSYILRFGLPDTTKPMGLTTCACILASAKLMDRDKGELVEVTRPYTPISTNDQVGCFDLLIKDYGENGYLSKYLCEDLPIGGEIQFKHIDFNVKIPAPFTQKKIGMIAGVFSCCLVILAMTLNHFYSHRTGITPMIQALHAILGNGPSDQKSETEEVTLLYGSRNKNDILGGDMLRRWASTYEDKFKHIDVLSHEPADSDYDGERGFIDKAKIEKYFPPASLGSDVIIFVCGPPIMYKLLCGPRNEEEVTGILGELGYSSSQVFKF
eukprot:CCRYP_017863-RB/>CCRYP_017863-RB protein AED:0.10 eAED:0.10 QI:44/0.66/0.75/1/0.66/0.75/4/230/371